MAQSESNSKAFPAPSSSVVLVEGDAQCDRWTWFRIGIYIVLLAGMAVAILFSTPDRVYDERYYFDRTDQLSVGRDFVEVFSEKSPSAVGPFFPWLQFQVQRVAGDDIRWARLSCAGAMALCLILLGETLRRVGVSRWLCVHACLATPFLISSGMALTETWAVMFVVASALVLLRSDERFGVVSALGAGMLLALAVLTRQTSAVALPGLVWLLYLNRGPRVADMALLAGPPVAAGLWLLTLWGNVVPPGQEHLSASGVLSSSTLVQAAVYCGVLGALMNPTSVLSRLTLIAAAIGLVINLSLGLFTKPVLLTVFPEGERWTDLFQRAFWGAGMGVFLGQVLHHVRAASQFPLAAASLLIVLGVIVSCGLTSGQFSSRYVVLAIPFLVVLSTQNASSRSLKLATFLVIPFVAVAVRSLWQYGLW